MVDLSLLETIRALPKVELHRHLEGAVRLETLVDIAQQHGVEMPEYDVETLRPFVQVMPGEPRSFQNFLAKFRTIRQFFLSLEIIERITREAVIDAAADNIKYMELRFTPAALCTASKVSPEEVVDLVCSAAYSAATDCGIKVRLIVSMNRNESLEVGQDALKAALKYRDRGVVAVDLAGNEAQFAASLFRDLFKSAKAEGLGITLHAGEWEGAQSVWDAVGNLGADRIGHGIRVLEDPGIVNVLAERGVVLEVCPSSNVDSGVVAELSEHPFPKLVENGLKVTINSDDPSISAITLSDEIYRIVTQLPVTLDDVKLYTVRAAEAAFLPSDERRSLAAQFQNSLHP